MNAQGLDAQGKEGQMEKTDERAASPLQHGVMHEHDLFETQYMGKFVEQERCPQCDKPLIERNSPTKGTLFICKGCRWTSA